MKQDVNGKTQYQTVIIMRFSVSFYISKLFHNFGKANNSNAKIWERNENLLSTKEGGHGD